MVAKVDALMDSLPKGQALAYADLPRMTFMTRCITETLRLWPSVPNGEVHSPTSNHCAPSNPTILVASHVFCFVALRPAPSFPVTFHFRY